MNKVKVKVTDHEWLDEMMILHRFPTWLKNVTSKLSASWNTRIQCKTDKWTETSDVIRFRSGLPQGDALCPRLFTLCLNPVAWMLKATEGYKLSRPRIGSGKDHRFVIYRRPQDICSFTDQACNSDEVNTDSDERYGAEVEF